MKLNTILWRIWLVGCIGIVLLVGLGVYEHTKERVYVITIGERSAGNQYEEQIKNIAVSTYDFMNTYKVAVCE